LDSNNFTDPYGKFDTLIAVGAKAELPPAGNAFDTALATFRSQNPGWVTGFLHMILKMKQKPQSNNDGS
jgi:para-aminobenzoate synthetase component 1